MEIAIANIIVIKIFCNVATNTAWFLINEVLINNILAITNADSYLTIVGTFNIGDITIACLICLNDGVVTRSNIAEEIVSITICCSASDKISIGVN